MDEGKARRKAGEMRGFGTSDGEEATSGTHLNCRSVLGFSHTAEVGLVRCQRAWRMPSVQRRVDGLSGNSGSTVSAKAWFFSRIAQ